MIDFIRLVGVVTKGRGDGAHQSVHHSVGTAAAGRLVGVWPRSTMSAHCVVVGVGTSCWGRPISVYDTLGEVGDAPFVLGIIFLQS
jgi:hypothetical protein